MYIYMYIRMYVFSKKFFKKAISRYHRSTIFHKKRTLFFKRRYGLRPLIYKRLARVLSKRKNRRRFRRDRRTGKGKFFFKKYFYKTLLQSRKYLRYFFFLNTKVRQKKISKIIFRNKKLGDFNTHCNEYSASNILLRSHFCRFLPDLFCFFRSGFVFLNGSFLWNPNTVLNQFDCLQIKLSVPIYKYIISSRKFLKKKIAHYRYNNWQYFKRRALKIKQKLKPKKRKSPKYIYLLFLFKINVPRFLEIDYLSLSIFFIRKLGTLRSHSYYLDKLFSFKLFPLYNYKKVN